MVRSNGRWLDPGQAPNFPMEVLETLKKDIFIALIHPIQWTIALSDRSRQTPEKDVLYILPTGPVTECAFARWRIVLPFLSRQSDVIASFSFGAKSVQTCFLQRNIFEVLSFTTNTIILYTFKYSDVFLVVY